MYVYLLLLLYVLHVTRTCTVRDELKAARAFYWVEFDFRGSSTSTTLPSFPSWEPHLISISSHLIRVHVFGLCWVCVRCSRCRGGSGRSP